MLPSLRSIGRILRPLQSSHARFITTIPKAIPEYRLRWDTTGRLPPTPAPAIPRDAARDEARRGERAQLCHAPRDVVVIPSEGEASTPQVQDLIRKLNNLLRKADSSEDYPLLHWKLRDICGRLKRISPRIFAQVVLEQAWDVLWSVQERASKYQYHIFPPDRKGLWNGSDFGMSCKSLGHRVDYLTKLFHGGNQEQALKEWEEDRLGTNSLPRHDYKPEHIELGATMYALHGDPDRAREIMEELFELYPTWSRSVIKTVFCAHTACQSEDYHQFIKDMYKEYKANMADSIRLEDFDAFFSGFLGIRDLTSAKVVFRDMVRRECLATSLETEEVEKVLSRLHSLCRLGTNISELTLIGLQAISVLPKAYHYHVYDHWLRFAKMNDAPEVAANVLEMMFERGAQPNTLHFNLLFGAFLKVNQTSYIMKGEAIGWRMIEETVNADYLKLPPEAASKLIAEWKEGKPQTSTAATPEDVPQANVTTFALLMRHHALRSQWEHVSYLQRKFRETGLPPNATLLNALIEAKYRQGQVGQVWKIYKSFTDVPEGTPGVFPNGSTMRLLWASLRHAHRRQLDNRDPHIPKPRELLAETVQWWERCRLRPDVERFRIGLAGKSHGMISDLVTHCFSSPKDLAGSLVAQHILGKHMGIYPSAKTAANFRRQAVWEGSDTITTRGDFWRFLNGQGAFSEHARLQSSDRVYEAVAAQQRERMEREGLDIETSKPEDRKDYYLNTLSGFVRVILQEDHPPELVEAVIDKAKRDAGVPDMEIEDLW